MAIQIRWLGHSCFAVECEGYKIVLDPFEPGSVPGLLPVEEEADLVLCSHEHFDHNYRAGIKTPDTQRESPFRVTALSSYHDGRQGALRGKNTIFLLEAAGMRVVHFGDVGCMPGQLVLEKLRGADAVMVPVGGHYTVDATGAKAILDEVQPRVTIPMHYRSEKFGFDVLGTLDSFTDLYDTVTVYDTGTLELMSDTPAQVAVLACPVEG